MDLRQHNDELVIKCVPFDQLDTHTLYDLLALRMSVFCVEQNCPYLDADGKDHYIAGYSGEGATTDVKPGSAVTFNVNVAASGYYSLYLGYIYSLNYY